MSELGRRSARLANVNQPMKPLGVCNSQTSYDRKSINNCLQKSPHTARKSLFEGNCKENEDYALCKEISSRRENTGKSPVVIPSAKISNADSNEKKKVKPRRSMLGLRSKTRLSNYPKDTTYTLSKPLLSSSPNNAERVGSYNHRELRKSISTPVLTPFDSDDVDTSAFFNKGISDSTWSVFKSVKKKSIFEPPSTRGSLMPGKARCLVAESDSDLKNSNSGNKTSNYYDSTKNRVPRKSLAAPVDQEVKLKWLAQKFQMNGNNSNSDEKYTKNMRCSDDEYFSEENGEVTEDNSEDQEDKSNSTLTECLSPIEKMNETNDENDLSSANSTDSYIQNETTILNSGKNNLDKIEEENGDQEYKEDSNDEKPDDCDEGDPIDIYRIISLYEDLKNEVEDMDSKYAALMEQREVFKKKWNDFNFLFRAYERNVTSSQKKSSSSNSVQEKSKKVISTKLRPSFVNPANICLKLPKASSNRNSEKKSNLGNNCKTPLSNDKLLKRFRKSTCYTPNSLSIMVDDQAKDIFGS